MPLKKYELSLQKGGGEPALKKSEFIFHFKMLSRNRQGSKTKDKPAQNKPAVGRPCLGTWSLNRGMWSGERGNGETKGTKVKQRPAIVT